MPSHPLAFTVLTSLSSNDKVVLSTHREYVEDGEEWVETYAGRVRKADIEKASQPLRRSGRGGYNEYGESITGDPDLDEDIREFAAEKRRQKLAGNPAATAKKATIELPVKEASGFRVGRWYEIHFKELDAGTPLRDLITNVVGQEEAVAVKREKSADK